eukprot:4811333-Pyramimonas_sp.AAC.1
MPDTPRAPRAKASDVLYLLLGLVKHRGKCSLSCFDWLNTAVYTPTPFWGVECTLAVIGTGGP